MHHRTDIEAGIGHGLLDDGNVCSVAELRAHAFEGLKLVDDGARSGEIAFLQGSVNGKPTAAS